MLVRINVFLMVVVLIYGVDKSMVMDFIWKLKVENKDLRVVSSELRKGAESRQLKSENLELRVRLIWEFQNLELKT